MLFFFVHLIAVTWFILKGIDVDKFRTYYFLLCEAQQTDIRANPEVGKFDFLLLASNGDIYFCNDHPKNYV